MISFYHVYVGVCMIPRVVLYINIRLYHWRVMLCIVSYYHVYVGVCMIPCTVSYINILVYHSYDMCIVCLTITFMLIFVWYLVQYCTSTYVCIFVIICVVSQWCRYSCDTYMPTLVLLVLLCDCGQSSYTLIVTMCVLPLRDIYFQLLFGISVWNYTCCVTCIINPILRWFLCYRWHSSYLMFNIIYMLLYIYIYIVS